MKKGFSAVWVLLSLGLSIVVAAEINYASVRHDRGIYAIEFDATLAAPPARVYRLLTDYDHLHDLIDAIVTSAVVGEQGELLKTRLQMHSCILFFCRDTVLVEQVQGNGQDRIRAAVVPAESDFRSGESLWTIVPAATGRTRVSLRRQLEPDFWVPPVIGPWLVKKKMVQELTVMLERLEQLARDESSY